MNGTLFLIPNNLGDGNGDFCQTPGIKEIINRIDDYVVESEKGARRFLLKAGIKKKIDELNFSLLNEHTPENNLHELLNPVYLGKNLGIISDAGLPAVADPGADLVFIAHSKGIRVVPLVGASSLMLALMASGLNGQRFCFLGYLPAEKSGRVAKVREIEKISAERGETQIFIEAPYRNQKLLEDLLENCKAETKLCIACDILMPAEFIVTKKIKDWKKQVPQINKRPSVFLIYVS